MADQSASKNKSSRYTKNVTKGAATPLKASAPKAEKAQAQPKKPGRIGRSIRGYDRKAVDSILRQNANEIAEVQGQLQRNKALLDQAQSERQAFLQSLDAAARSADELLVEATENATKIRLEALEEAERVRRVAMDEANEIVAGSKADMADYQALEKVRVDAVTERSEEMVIKIEADKDALSKYQNELSAYLHQLGQYLMQTSTDPTIALPLEQQPAITGAPSVEETIVLSEIEAGVDQDFAEFFSDDIEQDKSRDWILKD